MRGESGASMIKAALKKQQCKEDVQFKECAHARKQKGKKRGQMSLWNLKMDDAKQRKSP